MTWPPAVGEPLPNSHLVTGVRSKLMSYSLNGAHTVGGPKARGFRAILGITIEDLDYLVVEIETRVRGAAVTTVRDNPPFGLLCEVRIPVHGLRTHARRTAQVTTAWQLLDPAANPRLVSAYIRG